jgi:hypothetical protein
MAKLPKGLKRGRKITVHWRDITHDATAEPTTENAELTECETDCRFVKLKTDHGLRCIVVSSTGHPDGRFMGYDIIPLCVVSRVELNDGGAKGRRRCSR